MRLISFLVFAVLIAGAMYLPAFAQDIPGLVEPPTIEATESVTGLKGLLCRGAEWLFTFAIVLSIILAIWTGITYMRAGGDPEKFKAAHKMLLYLSIGIAVALVARVVPIAINGVLRGSGGGSLDVCDGNYTAPRRNPTNQPTQPPGPPAPRVPNIVYPPPVLPTRDGMPPPKLKFPPPPSR